jgi:ubiquinone/menaquinone biosynthesis C-methylase UbiE
MNNAAIKNADRFLGFADTYDGARPHMPQYPISVIKKYLGKKPGMVLDLGCGTGLSTLAWQNECDEIIGIEPNEDMISIARNKQTDGVSFWKAYSHDTGIAENTADVVICSQSFHWMDPVQTLREVNRVLTVNGIFATVDNDWPPVCQWEAEQAYNELFAKVNVIEKENPEFRDDFFRWNKNEHLSNIEKSGYFRYAREIVFTNSETCTAGRLVNIALSQGGLQNILKRKPELVINEVNSYKEKVLTVFGDDDFTIDFCYRMRIGIK